MDDKRQERKMDSKLLVRECNINLVLITEISLSLFDYKSQILDDKVTNYAYSCIILKKIICILRKQFHQLQSKLGKESIATLFDFL